MRLDIYLAKKKNGLTRSKAQRAIKLGFVKVNDKIVTKPALKLKDTDKVSITNRELAKMPSGYFKLKEIQNKIKLIKSTDVVLDLGSSAGGYLLVASELAKQVFGIEYSKKFEPTLRRIERKNDNIKIIIGDIFKMWPSEITDGATVDLILNDLTLDWRSSIASMRSVFPLLKKDGKILMTVKQASKQPKNIKALIDKELEPHQLVVEKPFSLSNEKNELYVVLKRS